MSESILSYNSDWIEYGGATVSVADTPPTPPSYKIRLKFRKGVTPTFAKGTATQVSVSPNVWDLVYGDPNWTQLCKDQTDLIEVISADINGVTSLHGLFWNCPSLTKVALFDTSSVISTPYMFYGCTSLTSVPLFDTSNVKLFTGMFSSCSALTSVPLFDTSNVTNMDFMFADCHSLTSVPKFNTSNVTSMYSTFVNCHSLPSIPLLDTSKVTRMRYMCASCRSLTKVPLFDTSSVTDMYEMCFLSSNVRSGALALYRQASTQTVPPANHYKTFSDCGSNTTSGRAELAHIPADWGGTAT